MSLDERVESLRAKHAALEAELDEENRRPHPDSGAVAELKRRKLRIKDELERIGHH